MLTAEELRTLVSYDPETGIFRARTKRLGSHRKIGDELGTVNALGYVAIQIAKKGHYAHRLAVLYMTGDWPKGRLDHVNGIRSDNRLNNLRIATWSQNQQNAKKRSDNTSGFKGVRFRPDRGYWISAIHVNGTRKYLGVFHDPTSAFLAYKEAAEHHFGEFARME